MWNNIENFFYEFKRKVKLVDIISLFCALAAIVISLFTYFDSRQIVYKMQYPYLHVYLSEEKSRALVELKNAGKGPAIIDKIVFTKGGEKYGDLRECIESEEEIIQKFQYKGEDEKEVKININCITNYVKNPKGYIISAEDSLVLFEFYSENPDQIHAVRHLLSDCKLEFDYSSPYDNKKFDEEDDFSIFKEFFETMK